MTTSGRRLEHLFRERLDTLAAEVIDTKGSVSETDLKSLERLDELRALRVSRESRRRLRITLVAIALVTFVGSTLLAFIRVSWMEVRLDLQVTELAFRVPPGDPQPVVGNNTKVGWLEGAGLGRIHVPRTTTQSDTSYLADQVRLSVGGLDDDEGTIEIPALSLPGGTTIRLYSTGTPRTFRLSVGNTTEPLAVLLRGSVRLDKPEERDLVLNRPRRATLTPGADQVDVDFALTGEFDRPFAPPTSVERLSLFEDYRFGNVTQVASYSASSIRSGKIVFESLRRHERELEASEGLRFKEAKGQIRDLRLGEDDITFTFHGTVRGMKLGAGDVQTTLMPTWFEWFSVRAAIPFIWGALISVVGLVLGVLRWWGTPA